MGTRRLFIKSISAVGALATGVVFGPNQLRVFLVDDGEQHWYAAYSGREALDAHERLCGPFDEYPEMYESMEVAECNLDKSFTIFDEHTGVKETKLLREWLAECQPGDVIATSVF